VIERGEDFRFALKSSHALAIVGDVGRQDLQRDLAFQLHIAGARHLAHAAFAQFGDDFIGADLSTLLKVALSSSKGESSAGGNGDGRV